jgi:hypothetical protein
MTYEGKFRDFMVGWLALQPEGPGDSRGKVKALMDAVVYAENDAAALAGVDEALGDWAARTLWGLSQRWYDTRVEMVRDTIEALRGSVQERLDDAAAFYLCFLVPFRYSLVPADFQEICWLFRVFYTTVAETVLGPMGWTPYVVVEPSYEGESDIVLLAYPQEEAYARVFVLQDLVKVWHLRFTGLEQLARELLILRQTIEKNATKAILLYRLAERLSELAGESRDFEQALLRACRPP